MSYQVKPRTRISLEQTIVRKDGTVEDRGIVAYFHTNPVCRFWFQIERLTKTTVPSFAQFAQRRREYHERQP